MDGWTDRTVQNAVSKSSPLEICFFPTLKKCSIFLCLCFLVFIRPEETKV